MVEFVPVDLSIMNKDIENLDDSPILTRLESVSRGGKKHKSWNNLESAMLGLKSLKSQVEKEKVYNTEAMVILKRQIKKDVDNEIQWIEAKILDTSNKPQYGADQSKYTL